ncbi:MAG TPA: hypothetical protein VGY98_08050 [Verrucomicrobiae bacterium]|nr:hypothetical protein [Verrucomicrobiae bacterium]
MNPATGRFLPNSTYDTANGWSINYALTYGEGGMLITPAIFTNTFVGNVLAGDPGVNPPSQPFIPALVTGNGLMFLSCTDPIGNATFYDVVGRNPQNGESVTMLDPGTRSTRRRRSKMGRGTTATRNWRSENQPCIIWSQYPSRPLFALAAWRY